MVKSDVGKGLLLCGFRGKKKRSGVKNERFHEEVDQGKFQSEMAGKEGRRLSCLAHKMA